MDFPLLKFNVKEKIALFHDFINVLRLTVGKDSFCVQSLIPSLRLVRRRTFSDDLRSTRKKGHASKDNVYRVATFALSVTV